VLIGVQTMELASPVAAVILAAGTSTRMGTAKQLLRLFHGMNPNLLGISPGTI
jgi:hypothetical protein